ncbi:MAG TPA: COX15/CtaA family protein [Chitinophagaceae bacterium]|nr:COX15/CtaA family protein [Chitinophagaceae bacterium]
MSKISPQGSSQAVAVWLLVGVGMIMIQILLGGVTRLTGSGLSITEWDIITGTLPPMNEQQWIEEFNKYKQTPQFLLLNYDFTLDDFKFIFFWEWFHRFWARLIGVVFAVPFIIFLIQKRFKEEMIKPLIILFLLGALQGAVGWIMVASGLTGDAIYVKPTRLMLHFILALGLLCYTFWFALMLLVPGEKRIIHGPVKKLTLGIILILVFQSAFGALMAGHKAATAAATWPDINGKFIPSAIFSNDGLLNLIENKITIHFIHRSLAYILVVLIIIWTWKSYRIYGNKLFTKTRWLPLFLVILQVILGVYSVLTSIRIVPNHWGAFEWFAELHQLTAMFLLLSLTWVAYLIKAGKNF